MVTEYVPLHLEGDEITMTASAAIAAGVMVAVSGDDTVATGSAGTSKLVGVSAFAAAASGDKITVFGRGPVHLLTAAGAITAGDFVHGAAAGAVASHTIGTNDAYIFGIALTTAADTASVKVMEI